MNNVAECHTPPCAEYRKGWVTMKIWKEFKEFAFKGNVVDMAVGVMIGGAFGSIVTSVINNLFTPLLSLITGNVDFATALDIPLSSEENAAVFGLGTFLQTCFDFLLMALCIFLVVKFMNKLRKKEEKKEEAPAPAPRLCPYCFGEINEKATRCPHCTSELK